MRNLIAGASRAIVARPRLTRWLLAGPGTLVTAMVIIAAMTVWLPPGEAEVDNLVYPLILAPLIWALFFGYAVIEENLVRAVAVTAATVLSQGLIVMIRMAGAA